MLIDCGDIAVADHDNVSKFADIITFQVQRLLPRQELLKRGKPCP